MVVRKPLESSSNAAQAFAREMQALSYSLSTFTLEIDGKPTLVLQAKWQVTADERCRDWVQSHWDQVAGKDRRGAFLRPVLKIRLARSAEKAVYEASVDSAELYQDVKVVKLVNAAAGQEEMDSADRSDVEPKQAPIEDSNPAESNDNRQTS
jgi:hypothetical protein